MPGGIKKKEVLTENKFSKQSILFVEFAARDLCKS